MNQHCMGLMRDRKRKRYKPYKKANDGEMFRVLF